MELIVHCGDVSPPLLLQSSMSSLLVLLSYNDGAGHVGLVISSDFRDDESELIDHCDDVSHPPLAMQPQSSQSPVLLSYADGAGHDGPCAAKSTDFRDERSELIVPCDDECCAAVATDNGGGGSGLTDDCEDVSLPPSHPPWTLLMLLLSCGGSTISAMM